MWDCVRLAGVRESVYQLFMDYDLSTTNSLFPCGLIASYVCVLCITCVRDMCVSLYGSVESVCFVKAGRSIVFFWLACT